MSEMFTCKYCGDNLPARFGVELADGQSVCPTCGLEISLLSSFDRDKDVLLITKYPLLGCKTGFTNVAGLSPFLNIDQIRKDCPDLKEITLSREEMAAVASCMKKRYDVDAIWTERYAIYKSIAYRIAKIMEVKPLSEKQIKAEVKDFWDEYEDDWRQSYGVFGYTGAVEQALIKDKFDFEAIKMMIAEIELK